MNISLSQYIEIINLVPESFKTVTAYQVELVSIALDQDPEEVKKFKVADLVNYVKQINLILKQTLKPVTKINIHEHILHAVPFFNLTFGQYIDLESYLKDKKFAHVAAALYNKQLTHQLGYKDTYESYDLIDIDYRAKLISQLTFTDIIGTIHEYIKFRQNLVKSYTNLFVEPEAQEDDLSDIERKQLEHQKEVHSQFAWESMLDFLGNGDITKYHDILNLPVLFVFNIASYKKNQLVQQNRRSQELANKYKKY